MTFPVIGPHLLNVINASLVSGVLPDEWKRATVVPIHKSGDADDPSNYRPVSVLPVVEKLAESVVCSQLVQYLMAHDVICDAQHGFRPGRSTESAMLDAVGYLIDALDHGLIGCLTTADTSKAFDSVQHPRLLEKLGWYGIQSHWFQAWLSDRVQSVRGGSTILPITHGVVQGSLLGPILFLIFTNDLVSHVQDSKVVMYADDVQFLHKCLPQNVSDLRARVEHTMNTAQGWYIENTLKINPSKTDVVLIKSRQRRAATADFCMHFGDAMVQPSPKAKVLGIVVDEGLTFESHVSAVVRRCYAVLGGLCKFTHRLPQQVKQMIVEALVFPHIVYCLTVWSGCGVTQRRRIQKMINHCAQVVKGTRRSAHVTPLLRDLKWPSLETLICERDLGMMHSILRDLRAPSSLCERVSYRSDVSARESRATHANLLELPRVRTEHARRFFQYRASEWWNAAPESVKSARTAYGCRRKARQWLEQPPNV